MQVEELPLSPAQGGVPAEEGGELEIDVDEPEVRRDHVEAAGTAQRPVDPFRGEREIRQGDVPPRHVTLVPLLDRARILDRVLPLVDREEREGQVGLRIKVDEQHPHSPPRGDRTKIGGQGRLPHATLVVHHSHGPHQFCMLLTLVGTGNTVRDRKAIWLGDFSRALLRGQPTNQPDRPKGRQPIVRSAVVGLWSAHCGQPLPASLADSSQSDSVRRGRHRTGRRADQVTGYLTALSSSRELLGPGPGNRVAVVHRSFRRGGCPANEAGGHWPFPQNPPGSLARTRIGFTPPCGAG